MTTLLILVFLVGCGSKPTQSTDPLTDREVCQHGAIDRRWVFSGGSFRYTAARNDTVLHEEGGSWGYHNERQLWLHSLSRNGEVVDVVNVYDYRVVGGIRIDIAGRAYRYCD